MTPKQKSNELIDKMYFSSLKITKKDAKNCALIAVEEILKNNLILFEDVLNNQYWQEVKQDIEKL
jgi:uncharacterized membrane protein YgaE (UPF0421/DUF939 family)